MSIHVDDVSRIASLYIVCMTSNTLGTEVRVEAMLKTQHHDRSIVEQSLTNIRVDVLTERKI